MTPDRLDYLAMLGATIDPTTQAARDAVVELVAQVRKLLRENANLRAVLAEHHRELSTIEAMTLSPMPLDGPDGLFELVARGCDAVGCKHFESRSPTDPAPVPSDEMPTSEVPELHGTFRSSLIWDCLDDDDGDPEGCV